MRRRPRRPARIERVVVRLVVLDADHHVLLFHTRDPHRAELGTWWELPGGGLDADETYVDAAVRELREETRIVVDPRQVGRPTWRRHATFRYRRRRHLQYETVVTVNLTSSLPPIDGAGRVDFEDEDYFGHRWWTSVTS